MHVCYYDRFPPHAIFTIHVHRKQEQHNSYVDMFCLEGNKDGTYTSTLHAQSNQQMVIGYFKTCVANAQGTIFVDFPLLLALRFNAQCTQIRKYVGN